MRDLGVEEIPTTGFLFANPVEIGTDSGWNPRYCESCPHFEVNAGAKVPGVFLCAMQKRNGDEFKT